MPSTIAEWSGNHPSHKPAYSNVSLSVCLSNILDAVIATDEVLLKTVLPTIYKRIETAADDCGADSDLLAIEQSFNDVTCSEYDTWDVLAVIHDAIESDLGVFEKGCDYSESMEAFHAHMDKFRIASPSYVGAA